MAARTRTYAVVGLTLAAAVTAGCSGSGSHAGSGGPASGSATVSGRNQPAPTESNPPGDIPDNQVYVAYRPTGGSYTGFTLKVPEGWARTSQGDTTAFTDKLNTVKITAASASGAPTSGSVTKRSYLNSVPRCRSSPHPR
ncbi:hypothetical protein [Streptomyces sp. NPDC054794]